MWKISLLQDSVTVFVDGHLISRFCDAQRADAAMSEER